MYKIVRMSKNGKPFKKALAIGETRDDAWNSFNNAEIYMQYPDTTIFIAVEV